MLKSLARKTTAIQFELFHAPRDIPAWRGLPQEVQRKTVALLTRLLREHTQRRLALSNGRKASHE